MVPGSTPGAGSSAGSEQRNVQQRQQQQSQQLQALVRLYYQQRSLQQQNQQGTSHPAPPGGQAPQGYSEPYSAYMQPPEAYPSGSEDSLPHTLPDGLPVFAPAATAHSQSSVAAQGVQQQQRSSYPHSPSHPPASAPPAITHSQQSSFRAQGVQQQQQQHQQFYPTSSAHQASSSRSTPPANAASSSSAVAHPPPSELSDEPYKALMNRLRSHFGPMDEAYHNLWRSHVLEMKELTMGVYRQGLQRIAEERGRTAEVQKRLEDMKSRSAVVINELQARLIRICNELRGTREALASAKAECERRAEEGKRANEVVDILRISVDTLSAEIDTLRKEKDGWMKEKDVWMEAKEGVRAEGKYLEHLRSVNGSLSAELGKLRGSEGSREGLVSKMGETVEVLYKDLEAEKKLRIEAERRVKELEGELSSTRLAQSAQPTASTSQNPYPTNQNGTIFITPQSNHPTTPVSKSSSPVPLYSPDIAKLSVHAFPEPKYQPIRTIVPRSPPRKRVRLVMEEEPEVLPGTRKGGVLASVKRDAQLSPLTPPPERVFQGEEDGQELESSPDQRDVGEEQTQPVAESSQPLSHVQTPTPTLSSSPNSQPSTPVQSPATCTQPPTPTTSPAFVHQKRKRTNEGDDTEHSSHYGSPLKRQCGGQEVIELKEEDEDEVMELFTPQRSPVEEGEIVDGDEDVEPEPREEGEEEEEGDGEDGNVGAGLGIEHMDLLYQRDGRDEISCRVCYHIPGHALTRFGPGVTWKQAVDHCVKEHKEYCREMRGMGGQKVVEMKVALGILGKAGKSVIDVLQA